MAQIGRALTPAGTFDRAGPARRKDRFATGEAFRIQLFLCILLWGLIGYGVTRLF